MMFWDYIYYVISYPCPYGPVSAHDANVSAVVYAAAKLCTLNGPPG